MNISNLSNQGRIPTAAVHARNENAESIMKSLHGHHDSQWRPLRKIPD
jgi:hypothetical protein